MPNIFYQKLKCLLSVASNVYLIKLILQLHMNKKSNLLLGFLLLYFCTELFLNFTAKRTMCGRVLWSRYRSKFATSKSRQIHVMCVKVLLLCTANISRTGYTSLALYTHPHPPHTYIYMYVCMYVCNIACIYIEQ